MPIVLRHPFLRRRGIVASVRTAALCNATGIENRVSFHNRAVHISVSDHCGVHPHYGCVVGEPSVPPFAADESDTHVTESVVHATVVADVCSPIPVVEPVVPARPVPVRWCPQCALVR